MQTIRIEPSRSYLKKLWVIHTVIAVLAVVTGYLFGLLLGIDEGPEITDTITIYACIIAALYWIGAMILSVFYARSLGYEIRDDEVIVRVGIVTRSVKHVPFRTVTNISIKRGILDRSLFDMGTLSIQTAGMSGASGAEQNLVGLENVVEIYGDVAAKLREFRGAMSPTAAGEEREPGSGGEGAVFDSILEELRAIRRAVEK